MLLWCRRAVDNNTSMLHARVSLGSEDRERSRCNHGKAGSQNHASGELWRRVAALEIRGFRVRHPRKLKVRNGSRRRSTNTSEYLSTVGPHRHCLTSHARRVRPAPPAPSDRRDNSETTKRLRTQESNSLIVERPSPWLAPEVDCRPTARLTRNHLLLNYPSNIHSLDLHPIFEMPHLPAPQVLPAIGDVVWADICAIRPVQGHVRFYGKVSTRPGRFYGIELMPEFASFGKNDGSCHG